MTDRSRDRATFIFAPHVPTRDLRATLRLARMAAEGLHGAARVELQARSRLDRRRRAVTIDTASDAGTTLACVFAEYARREFGPAAVRVALPGASG